MLSPSENKISYLLAKMACGPSEDSDAQADLCLRWTHSHFVGFVMRRLIYFNYLISKHELLKSKRAFYFTFSDPLGYWVQTFCYSPPGVRRCEICYI